MIEAIMTALAFGTFWFWAIITIASIIIISCVEHEHYSTPSFVAIILGIVYWKPIMAAPWQTIAIVLVSYAIVGVIWSTYKWYRLVNKKAASYRERYGDVLTSDQKQELKSEITVSHHKSRLIGWISFWPWSLAWAVTGDFFNMLYDSMVHIYQGIVDRALGGFVVEEDTNKKNR